MYAQKPLVISIATCLLLTACIGEDLDKKPTANDSAIQAPIVEGGLIMAGSNQNFADYYKQTLVNDLSYSEAILSIEPPPSSEPPVDGAVVADSTGSDSLVSGADNSTDLLSSTNLVEEGIDELDFVKQNATHIFTTNAANHNEKQYIKVFNKPDTTPIAQLEMPDLQAFRGLFLKDKQLFSLQQKSYGDYIYLAGSDTPTRQNPQIELDTVDVSDPTIPNISKQYVWDGEYQDSRRIGDSIFVVSESQLNTQDYSCNNNLHLIDGIDSDIVPPGDPMLWDDSPPLACDQEPELTAEEIAERMPVDISGNKVQPSDCYIPSDTENGNIKQNITLITEVDLTGNENHKTTCVASSVDHVYMSANAIYLTNSSYNYDTTDNSTKSETNIDQFSFNASTDNGLLYNGAATLDGKITRETKKFSLNEHDEVLRVFTTEGNRWWWGGDNSIKHRFHTLTAKTAGLSLEKLASIPNAENPKVIGKPNEDIKSIRYMGDEAYVVTFQRTDPLYKLDLSVADQPKIVGELEMPGYSTYLQRINDKYLMGVGFMVDDSGRTTGIQTTIFDTSGDDPIIVDQHSRSTEQNDSWYSNLRLHLNNDSRAITTVNDGTHLRVSVPYGIVTSNYQSFYKVIYENNSLEYNINVDTGKIDTVKDRNILAPFTVEKTSNNPIDYNNPELKKASNNSYNSRMRALIDNNDIYYSLYDGDLVKYNWQE